MDAERPPWCLLQVLISLLRTLKTYITVRSLHTESVGWEVSAVRGVADLGPHQLALLHLLHHLGEADPVPVLPPAHREAEAWPGGERGQAGGSDSSGVEREGLVERDQGQVLGHRVLVVPDLRVVEDLLHDHDLHLLHVQAGGGLGRAGEDDPVLGVVGQAGDAGGGGEEGGGGEDGGRAGDLLLDVEDEGQRGPGVGVSGPVSAL